jgi:hypothetical protein
LAEKVPPGAARGFQCRNCLEFINPTLTNCPYCGAVVELDVPEATHSQTILAQAGSEARILKMLAQAELVCFVLSFVPFASFALYGFMILLPGVPMLWVRWWVKYHNLQTSGQDYENAKRDVIAAAVIWSGVIAVWMAAGVLQSWQSWLMN